MKIGSRRTVWSGAEGVRLVAEEWGRDGAPPAILLHGGGQTRHAWGATSEVLAERGWYVIAVDQRGHGDSEWPEDGTYEIEDFGADLRALVSQLPQKPAVVGASLGGMATLAAQSGSAEPLFSAVVLVDITPRMEPEGVERIVGFMLAHPDGFARLEDAADAIAAYRPNRPRPSDLRGLTKVLSQGEDHRWRWRWDARFLTKKMEHPDEGAAGFRSRAGEMRRDLVEAARGLTVPTLLIRGGLSDLVSPEGAREFLQLVPHAAYVDVAGAGHMVAGDRNDAFTQAVVEFLDGIRCAPPA